MSLHFEKRLSLANGLAATGSGVGTLVAPPLITLLLEEYSLNGTLLILGALMLNICVCAALLRPPEIYIITNVSNHNGSYGTITGTQLTHSQHANPSLSAHEETRLVEQGGSQDKEKKGSKSFEWQLIKDPFLMTYCISVFLFHSGVPSAYLYIPSLLQDQGLSLASSAFMFSLVGAGDTVGRLGAGVLGNINLIPQNVLYVLCVLLSGVCAVIMPLFAGNYALFGVLSFFFGLGNGAVFTSLPVLLATNIGHEKLQSSFSILTFFLGVPILYAPALGGE